MVEPKRRRPAVAALVVQPCLSDCKRALGKWDGTGDVFCTVARCTSSSPFYFSFFLFIDIKRTGFMFHNVVETLLVYGFR